LLPGACAEERSGYHSGAPRTIGNTPEKLGEKLGMPLEKVRKVLKIAKEPISLETPIGDEEDLGDFSEDKNAILPIEAAIQSNLRETTTRVLASLTPREERVLRMRFGIGMTPTTRSRRSASSSP
jgi:RNA polymerase primary sigma factor